MEGETQTAEEFIFSTDVVNSWELTGSMWLVEGIGFWGCFAQRGLLRTPCLTIRLCLGVGNLDHLSDSGNLDRFYRV